MDSQGSSSDCYITSYDEQDYIEQWTDNKTDQYNLISVTPYPKFPHLSFTKLNHTHYQWCGPLLIYIQYFAKYSRARIRLEGLTLGEELFVNLMETRECPQIFLTQTTPTVYHRYFISNGVDDVIGLTSTFHYSQDEGILALIRKGDHRFFNQFKCLESEVYYGIIVSIIVISFLMALYKRSLKTFLTTFWSYLSVILSDYYSIRENKTVNRIIIGVWLISCTILLAAFSGQTRELLIKPKPIYWIDSWNDLYEWKHLKIELLDGSSLDNFIEDFPDDPMAQDLSERIVNRLSIADYTEEKSLLDINGLKEGQLAIVYAYDDLQRIKSSFTSNEFREDIDYHISKGESEPFFIMLDKSDQFIARWLNLVIAIIRESGIYNQLYKVGLNPNRIGPDYNEKTKSLSQEIESISFAQIFGLFMSYMLFNTIGFTLLIVELSYNYFSIRARKWVW